MSINETIIQAVTPIVPVCVPDVYRPDAGRLRQRSTACSTTRNLRLCSVTMSRRPFGI